MSQLIVIAGPTASGKTALAIQLAKHFKCDIISADSRQFFKEMTIGTAKPTKEELAEIPHHFINNLSIHQNIDIGEYTQSVNSFLENYFQKNEFAILVGGSGLYIDAVLFGLDEQPGSDANIRDSLEQQFLKEGIESLQNELQKIDPEYFEKVDINNPHRLMRAIEVFRISGKPYSSFRSGKKLNNHYKTHLFCLDLPREILYNRINERVDKMMENGLENEAKDLFPLKHLQALQTVGYKELFDYFENKTDKKTAIELIKQNTRRYAKRQLTWFRKNKDYVWINPLKEEGFSEIIKLINAIK